MKRIITKLSPARSCWPANKRDALSPVRSNSCNDGLCSNGTGKPGVIELIASVKLPVLVSMLCAVLMLSCVRDSADEENSGVRNRKGSELIFSLKIPQNTTTRAMGDTEDNMVNTVKVLIFEQGGGFKYMADAYQISTSGSDVKAKMFRVDVAPGTFDMVFLANAETWISQSYASGIPVGTTQAELAAGLKAGMTVRWPADNTSPSGYTPIPMWGAMSSVTIDEAYMTLSDAVSMLRMLARVDIVVMPPAQPVFKMKSVRVYNYNTQGQLIPAAGNWNPATQNVSAPSIPSQTKTLGPLTYLQTDANTTFTDVSCEREIYLFEALAGVNTSPEFLQNTCLIIGGVFGYDTQETYYRIDFARQANGTVTYLDLLRNHTYRIEIAQVSGSGYSILPEALNSMPVNIEADVLVWDNETMNNVVFDGQYMMSVDPMKPYLRAAASTGNKVNIVTNYPTWSYAVSYAGSSTGWLTVTSPSTPASNPGSTAGTNLTYDVVQNTLTTPRVAYIDITAGRLTMRVEVTQAGATTSTVVSSNCYILKPMETVIIPVARAFDAWAGSLLNEPLPENWKITVEPLWTDNTNITYTTSFENGVSTGYNANLVVKSTANVEGNAIVAVRIGPNGNSQDPIRWSWHLWITNYNPDSGVTGATYSRSNGKNTYVFMNRNLGAWDGPLATGIYGDPNYFGMLYQWGRKDPFPPARRGVSTQPTAEKDSRLSVSANEVPTYGNFKPVSSYSNVVSTANNLGNAIKNPYIFYFSSPENGSDWYTNSLDLRNDYLWDDQNGKKTIFDPCPPGWRVPAWKDGRSPWYAWPVTGASWNKGWTYNNLGFWPASGYRPGMDNIWGSLTEPMFSFSFWGAIYWSATPANSPVVSYPYLTVNEFSYSFGSAYFEWYFLRSGGLNIRCVRE